MNGTAPAPAPAPVISVEELSFDYLIPGDRAFRPEERQPFLQVPYFSATAGEIVVLIGDNGCGKTTFLRLLSRFLQPRSGTVATTTAPLLVHQKPYLFAESLWANVAWPLRIRHTARDEVHRRVTAALELVGLQGLPRRWAPFLSGGEKQRAALARALVLEPEILLLDEPTSNIDSASVATIEEVLQQLSRRGVTIIMSTHNLPSAYRLATRIVPMTVGRIVPLAVNVLTGLNTTLESEHIGRFAIEAPGQERLEIFCPAVAGEHTRAVIPMDDIILSSHSLTTSAQNHLSGVIHRLEPQEEELVRVEIAAPIPLSALVTERSVRELGLAEGLPIHATFKASAVRLY